MRFRAVVFVLVFVLPMGLFLNMFVYLKKLNRSLQTLVSERDRNLILDSNSSTPVQKRPAPLFILHVGPGKTGTTTIQWAAANNEELLRQHNIYFLGNHGSRPDWNLHDFFRLCYEEKNKDSCVRRWKNFGRIVDAHYSLGHNVFVSEEMITGFRSAHVEQEHLWNHLLPLLSKWRVKIVISYRSFLEWIPSKYHQGFSPNGPKHAMEKKEQWPDKGGKPIPTLPNFFEYLVAKENFTFPHAIKKRWESHFDNVKVFNMHQEGDFLENFYCQMLPEAPALCEELSEREADSEVKNSSTEKPLHFDMIAVQAYQKGWVSKHLTRMQVADAVKSRLEKLGKTRLTDFPLVCMTNKQSEMLLEFSLNYELDMVPDWHATPKGESGMKRKFLDARKKKKLCSIDVHKTLKQQSWRKFFSELNDSSKPADEQRAESRQTEDE